MEYITPILTTQRLILRPLSVEDTQEMFHNWPSDAKVTKYLTWAAYQYEHEVKERLRFQENATKTKKYWTGDWWSKKQIH